ncbi:MAG TPA: LuxR C-terminal-related transcriptional regulator [Actinomycetota bacterium]
MIDPADIDRARGAVERRAWSEAYEILRSADPGGFAARDLEGLADAAWWGSEIEESIDARRRAHSAYVAEGNERRAGLMAGRLAVEHLMRGDQSVGLGWLRRSGSHLRGLSEGPELALLLAIEGLVALQSGDVPGALTNARRGREIAARAADPNSWALATVMEGLTTVASGRVADGIGLLDEVMTAVVAGELDDYYTGAVYCMVIGQCLTLGDVRRATEWSEAAKAWCESIPPESPYPGQCRIDRAEVARLRGAWAEAEAEALRAADELIRFDPLGAASAFAKVGEVRRHRGDLQRAEEAFVRARELGLDPQPAIALLRLARGHVDAARKGLALALSEGSLRPTQRAALLSATVEVELTGGDVEAARAAADEVGEIAAAVGTAALEAAATSARGAVALSEGSTAEALEALRRACALWQELRIPYEAARARRWCGLAHRAAGDEEEAEIELRAALAVFERLGAVGDVEEVTALLRGPGALPGGLTDREVEVLRLVASGKTNRDIAVELVISEHTVARHLQNLYAKLGVSSRSAATAFAFEHGLA